MDIKSVNDARFQKEQLGFAIDAYLRSKGWIHTSSTPGSYWMWEKKLEDGRTVLVDTVLALRFQEIAEIEAEASESDGDGA